MTATLPTKYEIQDAIVQAIGQIAGCANVATKAKDVRPLAFTIMGIDPDSFDAANWGGVARNPAVKALTSNYYLLKKKGLTADAGRGKYALTDTGFAKYAKLAEANGQVIAPVTVTEPSAPTPTRKAKATKAAPSNKKVTVMAGGATLDTPSTTRFDAHLIQLQKANSPCFGLAYSSASKVCNRCPIAGFCQRKRFGALASLARLVQQGISDDNLGVALGLVAPPEPEPVVQAPEPTVSTRSTDVANYTTLPVELDGVPCDCCKTHFVKGEVGVMVPNYGMVHEACLETAVLSMGA